MARATLSSRLFQCQKVLRGLQHLNREFDIQQIALIEVPPYGEDSTKTNFAGLTLIHSRLPEAQEWIVKSPVGLVLDKGVAVNIYDESDLLKKM